VEKAFAEGKWGPEVIKGIKTYISIENRYAVTLIEES
jgi:hypothetical protein